ncbi:DUF3467 domain-containing protein [bacterium]|nr:DUF3467 domain-containing protein [candidate division CSSED10-310 bacterium]
MSEKLQQKKMKFHIDPQNEGGQYSNIATVIHSETEFLVDFGMFLPGRDSIRIASRIVLSPRTAKQFLIALNQNIQNYESKFGEIHLPKGPPTIHHPSMPDIAQ